MTAAAVALGFDFERTGARVRIAMAGGLFGLTVLMSIGIFLVATGSWLARIQAS